jgi:hypothetical protein
MLRNKFNAELILTAIGFLARRRDNEATGMYSRYMRIAS